MEEFKFLKCVKKLHPTKCNELEYLDKSNAIGVILFDNSKENLIMVKQYRAGSDDYQIEICAGLMEDGENPLETAYRELREETGYTKDMVEELVSMPNPLYVSPGYTTEKIYIYGTKLKDDNVIPLTLELDDTEDIEVVKMKVSEVLDKCMDMKTILAVLYFKDILS